MSGGSALGQHCQECGQGPRAPWDGWLQHRLHRPGHSRVGRCAGQGGEGHGQRG